MTAGQQEYKFLPEASASALKELIYQHRKIVLVGSAADLENIKFDANDIDEFNSIDLRQRDGILLYKMRMLVVVDDKRNKMKSMGLTVEAWGPKSTRVGVVPNIQPGNNAGIWVKVEAEKGFGEVQLIFDGKPAVLTRFSGQTITAAISAENFKMPGEKPILIRQVLTGREFPIGSFLVAED